MKFMISCRHPLTMLKKAQEIRINYKDIARIKDLITKDWTSKADIVIYIPSSEDSVNWEEIRAYKDILNIAISVEDTNLIPYIKELGFPVFWSFPASNFWELRGLIDLGVSQIILDGPLFFSLDKVKSICSDNIELRVVVNKCFNNYMDRKDGICGTYIRPEDINEYSKYIEHFEFITDDLTKERILYNIYTKDTFWPDDLNILLTNLKVSVNNRGFEGLPESLYSEKAFAQRRMNCGQICQENPFKCKFCYQVFDFINTIQKHLIDNQ